MNEKKGYKVSIFGDTYSLLSDESENHIFQSAQLVDGYMKEIAHKIAPQSRNVHAQQCAVLAALQIASALLQLKEQQKQWQEAEQVIVTTINNILLALSS